IEGAERRQALVRNAAPGRPALRSGRSLDRQGPPANDAGRRAFRRSTAAFRETETSLQLRAGLPRSTSFSRRPLRQSRFSRWSRSGRREGKVALLQQVPCRAVVVPPGRGPGAARVRGDEPRPQGPPSLHPPNVSGRRPGFGVSVWTISIFIEFLEIRLTI